MYVGLFCAGVVFFVTLFHIECEYRVKYVCVNTECMSTSGGEGRGLTACARRNKACVFRNLIHLGHSVISPKYSGTQIISEIPTQID